MKNKGNLSDFEYSMVVGARQAGMCIWKTADLHGFSCTTISRVYKEWSKEGKNPNEQEFYGQIPCWKKPEENVQTNSSQ